MQGHWRPQLLHCAVHMHQRLGMGLLIRMHRIQERAVRIFVHCASPLPLECWGAVKIALVTRFLCSLQAADSGVSPACP